MAYDTIIEQGFFTSDGLTETLTFRQDVDWIHVYNNTAINQAVGGAVDYPVEYFWQRGMANGRGILWTFLDNTAADPLTLGQIAAGSGFTPLDTSVQAVTVGPAVITNITGAAPPVVTSAAHGLQTGDIVRLENTVGAVQLDGIDFHVTRTGANTFSLTFFAIAPAAAAAPGATANFRLLSNERIYQPKERIITNITAANPAVVTMAAPHDFTVGQRVRFQVPRVTGVAYGMTEIDGLEGTVTAAVATNAANTISVDIDATGFTAFAFPLTGDTPFTPAQVIPVGMDTGQAITSGVDILADATLNTAILGMTLAGGVIAAGAGAVVASTGPAGALDTTTGIGDVMFWRAGKSFGL